MKFYKVLAVLLLPLALYASSFALEVDEDEIRSTGNEVVQFENYSGPHAIIETAEAITDIGRGLGTQVSASLNASARIAPGAKYSVIHAIDPSETGKFDADIIFINEDASVDHIRNLRRIIAGYLMGAYGYDAADASTLATFVTVYNAVYRNKLDIFRSKYKDVVIANLTEEQCGLSTRWSEWPGNSQIVIPLFDLNSDLSSVNTTVISDQRVIDSIREQDDRGIDERKNLADLMEREADSYADKAQAAADRADAERAALAEQQRREDEARRTAEQAQQAAEQAQKAAEQAERDAEKARQTVTQTQTTATQTQTTATQTQQAADKAAQDAQKAQQAADKAAQDAQKAQQAADKAAQDARDNPDDAAKQQAADKAAQDAQKAQQASDKAAQDAQKAQQTSDKAAQDAQKAQQAADKAAQDAQKAQQASDKAAQDAQQAQQTAQSAAQQATRTQQQAAEEQKKTETQRTAVSTIEQEAAENQAIADKKLSEAQKTRTEIAKDQQKMISDQLFAANNRNAVIGLRLTDSTGELSGLVKVDASNGQVLRESPVTVVRGRTILPVTKDGTVVQALPSVTGTTTTLTATESGATATTTTTTTATTITLDDILYMAICGENKGGNSAVKLCLLDSRNMEIQAESKEIVSEDSVLVQDGTDYYCVIQSGSDWVVGKYDGKLNLLLKSPQPVQADTPITITPVGIIVTAASYQTVLLNLKDLKPITDTTR